MKRPLAVGLLVATAVLLPAPAASAHPLGNFTVNTASELLVAGDGVAIGFVVDRAEVPTLQVEQRIDTDGDRRASAAEDRAFSHNECGGVAAGVEVRLDDRPLPVSVDSVALSRQPAQAGLSTLRVTCRLAARTGPLSGEHRISYRNSNFTERVGWREITAVGDQMTLVESDVRRRSLSGGLTRYPENLLSSPVDERAASLVVRPGGPPAATTGNGAGEGTPDPAGVDRLTRSFTSFVARQDLSIGLAAVALLISVVLGALHAFAPGHGKTIMAAYLIGERGSLSEALAIGLTVTATHTAGVLALGLAISASSLVAPERLYPWFGLASGLLIVAVGVGVLLRGVRAAGRGHHHGGHGHDRGGPGHRHDTDHLHDHADEHVVRRGPGRRQLLLMGFAGGLLPSPSAVVVLLGAVTLGRAWFGVALVVTYGIGMAAALTGTGIVFMRARGSIERRLARFHRHRTPALERLVPMAAAGLIVAVGSALTLKAVAQLPG